MFVCVYIQNVHMYKIYHTGLVLKISKVFKTDSSHKNCLNAPSSSNSYCLYIKHFSLSCFRINQLDTQMPGLTFLYVAVTLTSSARQGCWWENDIIFLRVPAPSTITHTNISRGLITELVASTPFPVHRGKALYSSFPNPELQTVLIKGLPLHF